MKLIFAEEDSIFGIVIGLILVGLSGKYFGLPKNLDILWGILFCVSLILSFLDFFHSFSRIHRHISLVALHWITNVIDITLEITFVALFFNMNIPLVSTMTVPLFQDMAWLLYAGAWFVVSNVFWTIMYPFAE